MEYFAQDEATRLDPGLTVYETLASGSPTGMVPAIRNILGGFLFSGDDVYKKVAVLSGGERTRLAVARMLLRPSNTLLLDEPTNHLDLDSKDVLLEALEDYGGTLVIVSHDRYFVERLATKIVEIGHGAALVYPGTYPEFLWHKEQLASAGNGQGTRAGVPAGRGVRGGVEAGVPAARGVRGVEPRPSAPVQKPPIGTVDAPASRTPDVSREERKRMEAERRKKQRSRDALSRRIADLESLIADREAQVKDLEAAMSTPGFYENHETSKPAIERHQSLMWEVGDLIAQWEALQEHATES
jgi:ATP-binding cassette subfamily F protein 3